MYCQFYRVIRSLCHKIIGTGTSVAGLVGRCVPTLRLSCISPENIYTSPEKSCTNFNAGQSENLTFFSCLGSTLCKIETVIAINPCVRAINPCVRALLMQCFERNIVVIVMKGTNAQLDEFCSHNSLIH